MRHCYASIGHDKDCGCEHCRHDGGESATCDHLAIERLMEELDACKKAFGNAQRAYQIADGDRATLRAENSCLRDGCSCGIGHATAAMIRNENKVLKDFLMRAREIIVGYIAEHDGSAEYTCPICHPAKRWLESAP